MFEERGSYSFIRLSDSLVKISNAKVTSLKASQKQKIDQNWRVGRTFLITEAVLYLLKFAISLKAEQPNNDVNLSQ
ncbi:hypothetical protein HF325_002603 [Metschnikowia pulcherrima]|uniref:Uncharacterized protein n=1 Tax=Metschnikowia pulcherrima TaxID=27326 RepID=A0A8H7LD06_9ASCO|nr:hypothetical protein HF325_002603 [Metschnikowia pulcherrima]